MTDHFKQTEGEGYADRWLRRGGVQQQCSPEALNSGNCPTSVHVAIRPAVYSAFPIPVNIPDYIQRLKASIYIFERKYGYYSQ